MPEPIIVCENVVKIYKLDAIEVEVLHGIDLTVETREVVAVVGVSCSGKTTLLNILGGLDRASEGRVRIAGNNLQRLSDRALDRYRARTVGFVWQDKARNLVPYLNVEQNIALPMIMSGVGRRSRQAWARELIESVGLGGRRGHKLAQLSGGEQQRVAIAVALANRPRLLLADEPTGELDSGTAETIFELFHTLNQTYGVTVVLVSHDSQIAHHVHRVVTIQDGRTIGETRRRPASGARNDSSAEADQGAEFENLIVLDAGGRFQLPRALRERYGITNRIAIEETPQGLFLHPVGDDGQGGAPTAGLDAPAPQQAQGLAGLIRRLRK